MSVADIRQIAFLLLIKSILKKGSLSSYLAPLMSIYTLIVQFHRPTTINTLTIFPIFKNLKNI